MKIQKNSLGIESCQNISKGSEGGRHVIFLYQTLLILTHNVCRKYEVRKGKRQDRLMDEQMQAHV